MKFTYLWIDLFSILVPFLCSFHPKLEFYKKFKFFFSANILVAVVFIIWDIIFTKIGVWGFNPNYLTGIQFFNLPIEEVLFFICIPFSCVFTYHCINLFFNVQWSGKTENIVFYSLVCILMITGVIFYSKLYTSSTFISLSLLLIVVKYLFKNVRLSRVISIYLILLIPFFIVNGLLTGTGLEKPVVWYNNFENLDIRLLTIPVEDVFYGFELFLANVVLYEYFKKQ